MQFIAQRAHSDLRSDARLRAKMSLSTNEINLPTLFSRIYHACKVRSHTTNPEQLGMSMATVCDGVEVASVMDAAAALWTTRWQKNELNEYLFLVSEREMDTYLPKNEFARRRYETSLQFVKTLGSVPPKLLAALQSRKGVRVRDLPPSVMPTLLTMVDAMNEEDQQKGHKPFPLNLVPTSNLMLEVKHLKDFKRYWVRVSHDDWGSMGWAASDYMEKKAALKRKMYSPDDFTLTKRELRNLPALRRPVRLQMKRATLLLALRELQRTENIPFLTDPEQKNELRPADIDLGPLPLGDLLDALGKLYPGADFEYRYTGFLVVRAPRNFSNRHRKQRGG